MTPSPRQTRLAGPLDRAGQGSLRAHNLRLVFTHIAAPGGPWSRADVAETTGLTRATVSSLVDTLLANKLVVELAARVSGRAGRPAIPLAVAPGTVAALGLEINVDFLGVRALDLTGDVLAEQFSRRDLRGSDPAEVCVRLVRQAYDVATNLVARGVRVIGAGLALPGIADHPSGPLRLAPNLGWRDLDVREVMTQALAVVAQDEAADRGVVGLLRTVIGGLLVDNEANLAARTEIDRHQDRSFIYVSGQIGIGAAIVVDGQVFSGLHGWAGEIGHVVVDPDGPTCACGATGCLEMYAGKASLMAAAGLDPEADISGLLVAYEAGSASARTALGTAAEALGIALANAMNVVDVGRVILGGCFAPLTEYLRPGLAGQISHRVLSSRWVAGDIEIRASDAREYAAATGSALTVFDHAVADPASPLWA